jgi:GrpB-like predicted nucleotidyltransferase (UPF0157 family)
MMRQVVVVPYDPQWPIAYLLEAACLKEVFDSQLVSIHHIGSTAIGGMAAKPVIDIMIEVVDIDEVDRLNDAMAGEGYIPRGEYGIPGRRFFIKPGEEERTHHVHVFQSGSSHLERHLNFRDYMRTHPREAEAYSRIKLELAAAHPDIEQYMDGKDAFIKEADRRAEAWVNSLKEKHNDRSNIRAGPVPGR